MIISKPDFPHVTGSAIWLSLIKKKKPLKKNNPEDSSCEVSTLKFSDYHFYYIWN